MWIQRFCLFQQEGTDEDLIFKRFLCYQDFFLFSRWSCSEILFASDMVILYLFSFAYIQSKPFRRAGSKHIEQYTFKTIRKTEHILHFWNDNFDLSFSSLFCLFLLFFDFLHHPWPQSISLWFSPWVPTPCFLPARRSQVEFIPPSS